MATDLSGSAENGDRDALLFARVPGREIFAVVLWTLLADLLIFRASGYSGRALFFALAPLLFFVGSAGFTHGPARKLIVTLILLVAVRLFWAGSGWTLFSGIVLVIGLSMSAAGSTPYVLERFRICGTCGFRWRPASSPLSDTIWRPENNQIARASVGVATSDLRGNRVCNDLRFC